MSETTKQCPFCMETVNADAKKCRHCGEILDTTLREIENLKRSQNNGPTVINNNNNNNNNNAPAFAGAPKSRIVYILLAFFFGLLGVHNFYAGRIGAGIGQLLITLILGWIGVGLVIVCIWVLIEMITVTVDGRGIPFN